MARPKPAGGLVYSPDTVAERIDEDVKDTNLNNTSFEYDVIIVGGGTAGCALASRLSEIPNLRVLLIEAGGSSRKVLFSRIPLAFTRLFGTSYDHKIVTEPQIHAENKRKPWPRAKLLGGCTTLNALMFQSGAPSDYDEWAKTGLEGAEEWGYQALRKYFLKFERYNPHPDFPDVDLKERGRDGPVDVGLFGYCSKATRNFIKACANLGIPENPDVNSPSRGTLGVTKIMTYIHKNGTRVTAESAYLTPKVLERPNLKVVLNSTATRIIFSTEGGKKRAIGLEFAHRKEGSIKTLYRVKVKKELIMTAGAVHSPHILLLSGVGPKDELEKHNIPIVHDLRGVGRNLQDHLVVFMTFGLKSGHSLQHLKGYTIMDKVRSLIDLFRWMCFGSGPLSTNAAESAAFVRSDDTNLFNAENYTVVDETSGLNAPDIELLFAPISFKASNVPVLHSSMNIGSILLRPQSRGLVALKSADPFETPLVDPRYLEKPNDIAVLVKGLKLIFRVLKTEPMFSAWKKHDDPLLDHDLEEASSEKLEEEVRRRIETLFHPTSTCRMAKLEDGGVVDARLKIHGLENVRVVDASIFPRIVSGHTTATVYAVAEKAADMIKQDLQVS